MILLLHVCLRPCCSKPNVPAFGFSKAPKLPDPISHSGVSCLWRALLSTLAALDLGLPCTPPRLCSHRHPVPCRVHYHRMCH